MSRKVIPWILLGWSFTVVGKGGMGPNIPVPMGDYKIRADCQKLAAEMKPYVVYVSDCVETEGNPEPRESPPTPKTH